MHWVIFKEEYYWLSNNILCNGYIRVGVDERLRRTKNFHCHSLPCKPKVEPCKDLCRRFSILFFYSCKEGICYHRCPSHCRNQDYSNVPCFLCHSTYPTCQTLWCRIYRWISYRYRALYHFYRTSNQIDRTVIFVLSVQRLWLILIKDRRSPKGVDPPILQRTVWFSIYPLY